MAADTTVSVLGIEADGAPDQVATNITQELRNRVSSTPKYRMVPGRDLVEVKLVFSCPDEAAACMATAAKSLGAAKLLFGSVRRGGNDGYLVTLKMLDAASAKVEAHVAETISRAQASPVAIRGPVQKWFGSLTGQVTTGSLRVASDVPGASITLDGIPIGSTTAEPLLLPSIPVGRHQVGVTKQGYEAYRRDVDVQAGETIDVSATLGGGGAVGGVIPSGGVAPGGADTGPADDSPSNGWRTAAWTTAGGSALTLGAAVFFGVRVNQINTDLDPYRRYECPGPGTNLSCSADGKELEPLGRDERATRDKLLDDGKRFETLQYIFYGATAALVGASAFFFYKGYFDESASTASGPRSTKLVLLPTFSPTGSGVSALFRF